MKKTIGNTSMPLWLKIVLPGIYIAAALMIDAKAPLGLLTPFFAVMGMLFMALKYRPVLMIPWTVIYTVVTCSTFLVPSFFTFFSGHPYYDQYVTPVVRSGTYIAVGTLACYLCLSLNRIRKSEAELTHILESLPWPILTSDANGIILYWNDAAVSLLPSLSQEGGIHNYFDLLAPPEFYGRTISEYLKRLEQEHRKEPLRLSVNGHPFKGYTQMIAWTDQKVLLTILSEGELSPRMMKGRE
jgi:PAS domain-containing protein